MSCSRKAVYPKGYRGFESLPLRQIGNFEPKQNKGSWTKIKIMPKLLTKKEAVEFLGLDDKTFDNYFKNATEFPCVDRKGGKGRFYFDEDVLQKWKVSLVWRTVDLSKDDYALCLDFALAQHFRNYVQSDFGTGRQREFGQKITNWVKGQLGEVAVKKFLKREYNGVYA